MSNREINLEDLKINDRVNQYVKKFIDASDRSMVIVASSLIEHLLEKILKKNLLNVGDRDDPLFKTYAPLSTFSAKIEFCYRLRQYDQKLKGLIDCIRKSRNSMAHNFERMILRTPLHSDRLDSMFNILRRSKSFIFLEKMLQQRVGSKDVKVEFAAVCIFILVALEIVLHLAKPSKLTTPMSIETLNLNFTVAE